MTSGLTNTTWLLAAAEDSARARTVVEFGREGWLPWAVGFAALLLLIGWFYRRDTASLHWFWKIWLLGLRTGVLAGLLIIALEPQQRVETRMTRNSNVSVLVDSSVSMGFPAKALNPSAAGRVEVGTEETRAQAVEQLLAKSPLIETLRQTHDVNLYTFDSKLQPQGLLPRRGDVAAASRVPVPPTIWGTSLPLPSAWTIGGVGGGLAAGLLVLALILNALKSRAALGLGMVSLLLGGLSAAFAAISGQAHYDYETALAAYEKQATGQPTAGATKEPEKATDWAALTKPRGLETRLGESVLQALRETGETSSGIVLITDGGQNAGIEASTAKEAAAAAKIRLHTVGVGSTERPVNLQLANVQAPTHVHVGDAFNLTAYVQGQGLAGRQIKVELLTKLETDAGEPAVVETRDVTLLEDNVPVAVQFEFKPDAPGRRIFNVRVAPVVQARELTLADNEKPLPPVEVVERKTKILALAGGPMRDYQFVRNLLFRDPTIELDVWLQTGVVGISQESANLLFEFPPTREDLFKYDVIFCFDVNFETFTPEQIEQLAEWVYQQAGGLIFVAGEVHTPELATADDKYKLIRALYPVVLKDSLFEFEFKNDEFQQPWPVEFTREGLEADFLQLSDVPAASAGIWQQFTGVYRCYPTGGPKAGATVYAYFSDPRSIDENGKPVLVASQFYGAGRVLYLGSAETWRLRSIEEQYYERLWVKMVREVGQGRLLRGTNRGVLLLERTTYPLGSTVQVRANVLDPQFKELIADRLQLEVFDPSGRAMVPGVALIGEKSRPGQFFGAFSANLPGRYRLELPIPDSKDTAVGYVQIELPNLEFDHPEQDERLLRQLATTELGGQYFTLADAAAGLPAQLPDRSTTKIQFDVPQTLWDQAWVMYFLVGLLGLEWLTRKLLKLA